MLLNWFITYMEGWQNWHALDLNSNLQRQKSKWKVAIQTIFNLLGKFMHLLQGVLSRKFKLKAKKLNRTDPVCSKTDKSPVAAGDDSRAGAELSALVLTETTEGILRLCTSSTCSLLRGRRNSVVLSCFICLRFDDKGRNEDRKLCRMPLILCWNSLYWSTVFTQQRLLLQPRK